MQTRREMLRTGLAALGGIAGAQLLRANPATASTVSVPVFGVDSQAFAVINSALGGHIPGERCYSPEGVPAAWPRVPGSVRLVVASIRPNIQKVLSGGYDSQLRAYAAKIPAGQIVCVWNEGERHNLGYTAKEISAVQAHCYPILKEGSPHCKVVQVITTYSLLTRGKSLGSYLSPHVDAIYMDSYQLDAGKTVEEDIGATANAIHAAVGSKPLGIAEVNSQVLGSRANWFKAAWALAKANDYEIFMPFFNSSATYRWLPHDAATISALREMVNAQ
jgi:hypothetical protein